MSRGYLDSVWTVSRGCIVWMVIDCCKDAQDRLGQDRSGQDKSGQVRLGQDRSGQA